MTTSADYLIPGVFEKPDSITELARAHWTYTSEILIRSGIKLKVIKEYEFYYINAFIHGYKHGKNDRKK